MTESVGGARQSQDQPPWRWNWQIAHYVLQVSIFGVGLYVAYIYACQLDKMRDALRLQTKVDRASYGPNMVKNYVSVHEGGNGRVWADYSVINRGQTSAKDVAIAMRMEIRASAPTNAECMFNDTDFKSTDPPTAQALSHDGIPVVAENVDWKHSPNERPNPTFTTYVWGETRFTDFTDVREPVKFCYSASTKEVLSKVWERDGYYTPWNPCECKQK